MTLTYLLPLRRRVPLREDDELTRYVRELARHVDVVVVDGSSPAVREANAVAVGASVAVISPAPEDRCANGKAWGVLTGLRHVRADAVVIADDDVRWDADGLRRVGAMLESCDLVVPQNFFSPLPWHAAWDSGRILLNRAVGHDWPGTLALRCAALSCLPAYDGNVLFENCELVRTVRARRGRVRVASDLHVCRRPPTLRHFLGQRPRQAYDDVAQPARLAAMLAVAPTVVLGGRRAATAMAAGCVALAEVGRRRARGTAVFPWYTPLFAPLWLCERALLAWWVLWRWLTGHGVRYAGVRLVVAATPQRVLDERATIARRTAESSRSRSI